MSSAGLEAAISKAVQDGDLPGAVMAAKSVDGTVNYLKVIGHRTLTDLSIPLETSTPMMLASCTKLLTTIAALQLVEAGSLSLSDSVLPALPELAALPVLQGFSEAGDPLLVPRVGDITLRHLLTHSCGACYPGISPKLNRYFAHRGESLPNEGNFIERLKRTPLVYQPGKAWEYGTGVDCAGVLVERTSGVDLDSWMREHILEPLGLGPDSLTFWPAKYPGMEARKAGITMRDGPDARVRHTARDPLNRGATGAHGGHGGFGEVPAYLRVLESLIDPADERLLSSGMKESMFEPHLGEEAENYLNDMLRATQSQAGQTFIGAIPADQARMSWGLGGIMPKTKLPQWRGKGTLAWGGLPNLMWLADKERGVCAMFGTQVLPSSDPRVGRLIRIFEEWVYKQMNEREKRGREKL